MMERTLVPAPQLCYLYTPPALSLRAKEGGPVACFCKLCLKSPCLHILYTYSSHATVKSLSIVNRLYSL